MNKSTKEILIEAREIIKRGWCRGHFAKTKTGKPTTVDSEDACKFCAVGAIFKAAGLNEEEEESHDAIKDSINKLIPHISEYSVTAFNDSTNKNGILKVFNEAIKELE